MENTVKTALRWIVFVVAVAATTAWLVLSFTYLNRLGWDGILSLEPAILAATLAAVAAPPAALWLVLVVIAQQQELSLLRKAVLDIGGAMRRGQDQAEAQGRALLELTTAAGQGAARETVSLALDDLTSLAASIAERLGVLDQDGLDLAWARYGAGDRWAMLKPFLDRAAAESDFKDRLSKALEQDGLANMAADAFLRRVDLLRGEAHGLGEQKLARHILDDGPIGKLETLLSSATTHGDSSNEGDSGPDALPTDVGAAMTEERLGPQPTLFPGGGSPT